MRDRNGDDVNAAWSFLRFVSLCCVRVRLIDVVEDQRGQRGESILTVTKLRHGTNYILQAAANLASSASLPASLFSTGRNRQTHYLAQAHTLHLAST